MTGAELKTARTKKALTQVALASLLQVAQNTVYRWEAESRKIPKWVPMVLKLVKRPKQEKKTLPS